MNQNQNNTTKPLSNLATSEIAKMSSTTNDKRLHNATLATTMSSSTNKESSRLDSIKTKSDNSDSKQKLIQRRRQKNGKIPAPRGYYPPPGYIWDVVTGKERKRIMMDDLRGQDKENWERTRLRLRKQKRKEEREKLEREKQDEIKKEEIKKEA